MSQRLNVLHVLFESRHGGAHQRILGAASHLMQRNIHTEMLLPDRCGNAHQKAKSVGVVAHSIKIGKIPNPKNVLRLFIWLLRLPAEIYRFVVCFRKLDPHIVNVSGAFFVAPAIAARLSRRPVVWHLNDTITPYPISILLGLLVHMIATKVVAQGHAVASHYGISSKNYVCLYSGVDTDSFRPDRNERQTFSDAPARIRVGIIANWNPVKGLETFIESAALIKGSIDKNVEFVMAGARLETQRDYANSLLMLINRLQLDRNLIMHEFVEDTSALIRSLDILVMSSRSEGCPNVVLEAMASGTAVVASDVGCVAELLGSDPDHSAGILFPPGDSICLASSVRRLCLDLELRRRIGLIGRKRALERFTVEAYADKHAALYRSIAD